MRTALERKVKIEGLEHRVGRVLVPTLKEKRMKAGILKIVERKLYPGYVFVEMACEEDGSIAEAVWFLIKETSGVGDFIGSTKVVILFTLLMAFFLFFVDIFFQWAFKAIGVLKR